MGRPLLSAPHLDQRDLVAIRLTETSVRPCLAVLRYVLSSRPGLFSEAEDKEPVRVGVGPIKILQEVVIVGDPKRVQTNIPVLYIGGKRHAFDLGRNWSGVNPLAMST